ncbi:MAG: hypothetical protein LBB86_02795 [Oscillospiraceae bacterium]|nr:hypothetical protein [Oscillospiraceae bacterium]
MSISDIDKRTKTTLAYLAVSALCVVISNVYALFGHGIRSDAMDFMFLYPLVGGALVFTALRISRLAYPCRFALNAYNAGVALLALSALLKGIMDIAGANTGFVKGFFVAGCCFLLVGIAAYAGARGRKV